MKAKTFDQQFDAGTDISATLNVPEARRVTQAQKRMKLHTPSTNQQVTTCSPGLIAASRPVLRAS